MRIKCEMDLVNRILPSMNVKKGGKGCHTQLSIGRKPQSDNKEGVLFIMACTAKDRNGTKFQVSLSLSFSYDAKIISEIILNSAYVCKNKCWHAWNLFHLVQCAIFCFFQIRDNIEQIFAKFINEGKATIRLKDPPQDLCLCKV